MNIRITSLVELLHLAIKLEAMQEIECLRSELLAATEQIPIVNLPLSVQVVLNAANDVIPIDTYITDAEKCPLCGGCDVVEVDDHYNKCSKCNFSFVG